MALGKGRDALCVFFVALGKKRERPACHIMVNDSGPYVILFVAPEKGIFRCDVIKIDSSPHMMHFVAPGRDGESPAKTSF